MKLVALLMFTLSTVAVAQQPADDNAALAPFINEATVGIERYDLTKLAIADTRKWLLDAARAAKSNPRQSQYLSYLEKGSDLPRIMKVHEQLSAAGVTRVYVVFTTAILADPPAFLLVPLQDKADPQKIITALQSLAPESTSARNELVPQQLAGAIVLVPKIALPGLKTLRAAERSDLLSAMQAAGDAPIAGGFALSPAVSMIFEQSMPTIPLINRPTSDITRNFRTASLAATPGTDPRVSITVQATHAQGAQVLQSVIADFAKLAASPSQRNQTPPIPQPQVNNDTLKLDLGGASLAAATFGLIDIRLKSQLADTMSRTRAILQICYNYKFNVEKGDRSWPADLETLVKSGQLKPNMLTNPRFPDQSPGFIYVRPPGNEKQVNGQTTIVLYESVPAGTPSIVAGYADGHAQLLAADEFKQQLEQNKPAAKK